MPVIAMNVPCTITAKAGSDKYGMPKVGATVRGRCAVVKLVKKAQHTTVRADSGATRGHADEVVADAVLLLPKTLEPQLESTIVVRGVSLSVVSVRHRLDVMGRIDHYEVGCSIE